VEEKLTQTRNPVAGNRASDVLDILGAANDKVSPVSKKLLGN
jgi:hypothetical protein